MSEELRKYRAVAITLIVTLVLAVGLFTHFLRIDLERAEIDLDAKITHAAARTETRLALLFERLESLGRARLLLGADDEELRELLRTSGLDTALDFLCVRDGSDTRVLHPASDTAAADRRCPVDPLPPRTSPRPDAGGPPFVEVRLDPAPAESGTPSLEFAMRTAPERELRGAFSSALVFEPFARAIAASEAPVSTVCLSVAIDGLFRRVTCEDTRMTSADTDIPPGFESGPDRTRTLDVAGLRWRLSVLPDHRRLAVESVPLSLALLGTTLVLGAMICAFVYSTVDRNLRLEAYAAEQRRLIDRLEDQNRSLDQFAAMAAHDLQAPMRFIVANTHVLVMELDELDRPDLQEIGATLVAQGERMRELVLDLLEFCRAGQSDLQLAAVDVAPLVEEEIRLLQAREEYAATRIVVGPLPQALDCDSAKLVQIIRNLLGNAVKFSQENARPAVSIGATLDERGRHWCFRVEDNGPGVGEEHRERVFLPFRRLDEGKEGTGMGLAIVRKLLERHGGKVWIDPQFTDGSAFCFTLPNTNPRKSP